MDNYQKVRCSANFKSISQRPQVKSIMIRTFECLRGVFPSCFASFADKLFQYFLPIIEDTVNLLEIYDNYAEVVNSILEMYVDIMEYILCFLNEVSEYGGDISFLIFHKAIFEIFTVIIISLFSLIN